MLCCYATSIPHIHMYSSSELHWCFIKCLLQFWRKWSHNTNTWMIIHQRGYNALLLHHLNSVLHVVARFPCHKVRSSIFLLLHRVQIGGMGSAHCHSKIPQNHFLRLLTFLCSHCTLFERCCTPLRLHCLSQEPEAKEAAPPQMPSSL